MFWLRTAVVLLAPMPLTPTVALEQFLVEDVQARASRAAVDLGPDAVHPQLGQGQPLAPAEHDARATILDHWGDGWRIQVFGSLEESARPCFMERVKGIEPSSVAWEATALPLSYTRLGPEL